MERISVTIAKLGEDQPLVWYEGSGTASRRWLHADNQGSVIARR